MRRREFLAGLAAGAVFVTPASAEAFVDGVVRQLKRLGFRSVVQERTLLGRVRITATRKDGWREIVVNPRTGEILRDLWFPGSGKGSGIAVIDDRVVPGGDDDDDDDDDDGDDDDGDDDGGGGGGGGEDDGGGDGDD